MAIARPPPARAALHLRLVLAGPLVPRWVADCVALWSQCEGLVLSLWWPVSPDPAPAWAPDIPATEPRRLAAQDHAGPVHLLLALDRQAARHLTQAGVDSTHGQTPQAASSRAAFWVLTDANGHLLADDWPLLNTLSQGRGLGLRLLAQDPEAQGWQLLRRCAHSATSHYRLAMEHLASAVQGLVLQALTDRRLGVAGLGASAGPGPSPRVTVWRRLLSGRWRACKQHLRSQWLSEYWRIGVVEAPALDWARSGGRLPVRWITPKVHGQHWADPMGMPGRDDLLFCEHVDESTGLGQLQALRLSATDGVLEHQPLAVGQGLHSSFPLVAEINGRCLGVAETAALRSSLLHEVSNDGQWRPLAPLLKGVAAADPAIFFWHERYWLAYTDVALGAFDNLCLYHALQPEGPWSAHANNPVKIDAGAARMAGGFFMANGQLYRPAQDCRGGYGVGVVLHRVLRCTPHEYREEPLARITPDPLGPCPDGLHTVSAWGQRTLIDGKSLGLNPLVLRRKLRLRFARAAPPPLARQTSAQAGPGAQRVAVYVPHLRLGGGETSLLRLAGGFAKAGLAVDLIVHSMASAELPVPEGVNLLCLDSDGTASAVHRLARVIRRRQPQCLLSAFPHTNVAAVAAVMLARVNCFCVVSEHAPLSHQIARQGNWRYRVLPPLVRWAYRRAAAVVAVSAGVGDDLRQLVGQQLALKVIANPVLPDADADAELGQQALHPWLQDRQLEVVLSMSRLSAEKDLTTLIRAFARLHADHAQTRLLLAGDGPEREPLQALVLAHGLQSVVQLPGRVARPMAWMRESAVFVLASQYEGFGNVLIEALASGAPVVATDCPVGPREILQDGRYGRLVPVGDAQAMAQALAASLMQTGQPEGAMAHAQQFTVARACAEYRQLFDQLVAGVVPC